MLYKRSRFKKKASQNTLKATVVIAVLCHILAIFAWVVFASAPPKEKVRMVAHVSVVDKLVEAPKPPPVTRPQQPKPKAKPKALRPPTQEYHGDPNKAPGKPGKPGAPGKPNSNGKKGNPGGSGRAGLRTKIDPNMPSVGEMNLGGPGYPTGHGYGIGNKEGTGSGFGEGDGEGNGDGGGEGGEGGDGGGGGDTTYRDTEEEDVQVVFVATDQGVSTSDRHVRAGWVVFGFRNDTSRSVITLVVEGQDPSKIQGIYNKNNWKDVPPGDFAAYQMKVAPGTYTITLYSNGYVLKQWTDGLIVSN